MNYIIGMIIGFIIFLGAAIGFLSEYRLREHNTISTYYNALYQKNKDGGIELYSLGISNERLDKTFDFIKKKNSGDKE